MDLLNLYELMEVAAGDVPEGATFEWADVSRLGARVEWDGFGAPHVTLDSGLRKHAALLVAVLRGLRDHELSGRAGARRMLEAAGVSFPLGARE